MEIAMTTTKTTPTIGVIGGNGGMGKWMARFFRETGYAVLTSGRNSGLPPYEMASRCQVVVIAVPLSEMLPTIMVLGKHMGKGSLLMDIASLKEKETAAMLKATTADVVGCHPLFGPRVRSLKKRNIILCPARGNDWLSWLEGIFREKGARVTITSPARHDELMAIVQALNHFHTLNMAFALQGVGTSLAELQAYTTPAFSAKITLIKKLCRNPHLYAEIITANPYAQELIANYAQAIERQKSIVAQRDRQGLVALLEECQKIFVHTNPALEHDKTPL